MVITVGQIISHDSWPFFVFLYGIHLSCVYVDNTRCVLQQILFFIKNSFDPFIYCLNLSFMKKQILSFVQILFRDVLLETSILQPNVNVAQPHLLHFFCYLN